MATTNHAAITTQTNKITFDTVYKARRSSLSMVGPLETNLSKLTGNKTLNNKVTFFSVRGYDNEATNKGIHKINEAVSYSKQWLRSSSRGVVVVEERF